MKTKWISNGVTRWVFLIGPLCFKFPKTLRGYLANQSEWRQRFRTDVNRPIISIFHLITIYKRASEVGTWDTDDNPLFADDYSNEERKGSSWGWFSDQGWVLIDFDRAWQRPYSIVGWFYYSKQERMARKWMSLPNHE